MTEDSEQKLKMGILLQLFPTIDYLQCYRLWQVNHQLFDCDPVLVNQNEY